MFSQVGTGVPCPPFLDVVAPFYPVSLCFMWWLVVVSFFMSGIRVNEEGLWILGSLARLPEWVNPCAIFPLWPLHTDPLLRHPGSPYAVVGVAHQCTIPAQGPSISTMSPYLTIRLQFFQRRRQNKKYLPDENIVTYVYTPKKIQSLWNQHLATSTVRQQRKY